MKVTVKGIDYQKIEKLNNYCTHCVGIDRENELCSFLANNHPSGVCKDGYWVQIRKRKHSESNTQLL